MIPERPLVPQGPQLVAPASWRMVAASVAFAFLLDLLPWPADAGWLVPDFLLMTLLYWHIQAPRLMGLGGAFGLGLVVDASHGLLIGQHAFTYTLCAFAALGLQRRLVNFPLFGRALHLAPLLVLQVPLLLLSGLWFGAARADWRYLAAGLLAALLWLPWAAFIDRVTGRPTPVFATTEDP